MARVFNNSPADNREDKANAAKFNMSVADWKKTNADRVADRIGQSLLDAAAKRTAKES